MTEYHLQASFLAIPIFGIDDSMNTKEYLEAKLRFVRDLVCYEIFKQEHVVSTLIVST